MLKLTGALLITAALFGSATASAATHTFTLTHARALDQRYEHSQGFATEGVVCGWVRVHVAGCSSKLTVVVIDGQPAERYTLIDYVTRSGACSNAGRIVKRVGGITYQNGGDHFGNCFTGPLVVEPHDIY